MRKVEQKRLPKVNEHINKFAIKAKVACKEQKVYFYLTSRNIVNAVKIAGSFFIEHVLTLSTDNFERIRLVEQLARLAK